MMTAAFSSKRMLRAAGFAAMRTITALTTSPFLTLPPDGASFTVATIVADTRADPSHQAPGWSVSTEALKFVGDLQSRLLLWIIFY